VGNGEDGLHLAWSRDGMQWLALNEGEPILAPKIGEEEILMRDPCIARGPEGKFHMVWTTGWGAKGIGNASSEDLVHWSEQVALPVMKDFEGVRNCWAPEIFYDADRERWLVFWASTVPSLFPVDEDNPEGRWNHRMFFTQTKDFAELAETRVLYDHGFSVIDGTVVRDDDSYVMFLKNEERTPPEKNLRVVTAQNPAGPWSPPSEPITGDYWAEGPTVLAIDGVWYVYFDRYRQGRFGVVTSRDLEQWEDRSEALRMPRGIRHGTAFTVTGAEFDALRRALRKR